MATYLVTQATGQQSRWVITHLLAAGAKVHALVRNPQKIPAVLENPNITIFKGESNQFEDVFQAAQGCQGVFLNTFPIPGLEVQQAETVVKACLKAGAESIVVSTTLNTNKKSMWDDDISKDYGLSFYFASKAAVEDVVRRSGFKAYTIVRPALLHFDYFLPSVSKNYPMLPTHGELDHALDDGVRLAHTDGHDVGAYAAAALRDPTKFGGQEIELSNESFTIEEARDLLVKVSGRDVQVRKRSAEEIERAKPTLSGQKFQLWANAKVLQAKSLNIKPELDIEAQAKEVQAKFGIPFTSFEAALRRDLDRLLECIPE